MSFQSEQAEVQAASDAYVAAHCDGTSASEHICNSMASSFVLTAALGEWKARINNPANSLPL